MQIVNAAAASDVQHLSFKILIEQLLPRAAMAYLMRFDRDSVSDAHPVSKYLSPSLSSSLSDCHYFQDQGRVSIRSSTQVPMSEFCMNKKSHLKNTVCLQLPSREEMLCSRDVDVSSPLFLLFRLMTMGTRSFILLHSMGRQTLFQGGARHL